MYGGVEFISILLRIGYLLSSFFFFFLHNYLIWKGVMNMPVWLKFYLSLKVLLSFFFFSLIVFEVSKCLVIEAGDKFH